MSHKIIGLIFIIKRSHINKLKLICILRFCCVDKIKLLFPIAFDSDCIVEIFFYRLVFCCKGFIAVLKRGRHINMSVILSISLLTAHSGPGGKRKILYVFYIVHVLRMLQYLRNRKYMFLSSYRNTGESLGEWKMMSQLFQVLPNFHYFFLVEKKQHHQK